MNEASVKSRLGAEIPLQAIPEIPHWNENYCWTAFDQARRISLYIHNGRWFRDTTLWHELVLVCIDGGQYFVRRNLGRLADSEVLGASCLQMRCIEPFVRWDWSYLGPALKGTAAGMMRAQPPDADAVLMKFDLTWQAAGPLVDFGKGTEPGASGSHYEQGGLLRGRMHLDGLETDFEGQSFRDHSRGPRVLDSTFDGHFWMHGFFPSGRTISSLIVRKPGGGYTICELFFMTPGGKLESAGFDEPEGLLPDRRGDFTAPFVVAATLGKRTIRISVTPQFVYPVSLAAPTDMYVGQSGDLDIWRIFQLPVHLEWDGEQTYGHLELGLSKEASRRYRAA